MTDQLEQPAPEVRKLLNLTRYDMRGLWRVTFWAGSAVLALAIVAGTAISDVGAQRLKLALSSVIEPNAAALPNTPVTPRTAELEHETQQLGEAVRQLTADRDRLKGRIAILEQSLDDITGAVKRQAAQQLSSTPQTQATATAATTAVKNPPPAIGAPQTMAAVTSPKAEAAVPVSVPVTTASTLSEQVPPPAPVAESIPLPPIRMANTASEPDTAAADQAPAPLAKSEIGVDLGGAVSLDALRQQWSAIKANHGPLLAGMRPSYAIRQKISGNPDYRLIVGPFQNPAAAMRLCSKLAPTRAFCRAGIFNVQQLAVRSQ